MDKSKIRALILDYGGVLSLQQNPENVNNILQTLHLEFYTFMQVYLSQRENYDNGQIRGNQYWLNVLQQLGLESKFEKIPYLIQEDIASWTGINDSMIQFISESRSKFFKLAIISNMPIDVLEYLRNEFQWLKFFDELIFSCEVKITKPNKEIYLFCLRKLNIPASECLFVDDSLQNVRAARELDMYAIHFRAFAEFITEFNEKIHPLPTA